MKTAPHWKSIGLYPHQGIWVFLSSLRSQKSCGIGEFFDLIPLIDWCKKLHLDLIQLLPLNDTGDDPSPYNLQSSCALDPIYLSLTDLLNGEFLEEEKNTFQQLNQNPQVDRQSVKQKKIQWLHRYFEKTFPVLSQTLNYQTFLTEHPWLEGYVQFRALKDRFENKNWKDWPPLFRSLQPANSLPDSDFYRFLQFLCFSQLEKVRKYADEKDVFLGGDIPILVSPDSADVWEHPSLFQLDLAAGAPPDYYNPKGQNWGFPLFNRDTMRQNGFEWWKQRLKCIEKLYHTYRIDHVVGFFRIWGIPSGKKSTEGHFVPLNQRLWESQGKEWLEMMIDASPLLPIAEDLGTIPQEVYPVLKNLGICGTKVVRWQRRFEADKGYIPYSEYEPFSLTTLSTPDCEPLTLWWKKNPDESVPFAHFKGWPYHPYLTFQQHLEILTDVHHTPSYFHVNLLQDYLSLFVDLTWPNPEEERINVPGTQLPRNWTYRYRPFVEEIVSHQGLAEAFQKILNGI